MSETPAAPPVLLGADEIRGLVERALALMDFVHENEDRSRRHDGLFGAAMEALRFAAAAAEALGDPALLETCEEIFDTLADYDDHAYPNSYVVAGAMTRLVRAARSVDDAVRRLSEHESDDVRAAIAAGLSSKDEASRAILERLAVDTGPSVRRAARERLGPGYVLPWWAGKFESDPLARLSREDAERLETPLRALGELLEGSAYEVEKRIPAIAEAAGALPDALAVEIAERVLGGLDGYALLRQPALVRAMVAREGGADAFVRLAERAAVADRSLQLLAGARSALEALPPEVCRPLARALLEKVARSEREERQDLHSAAYFAGDLLPVVCPDDEPIRPLLETVIAKADASGDTDFTVGKLAAAAASAKRAPDYLAETARVLEAKLTGEPKPLADVVHHFDDAFLMLPQNELRAAVERALLHEKEPIVAWGLETLLAHAHDEQRDGSPQALVERLFSDARLRPVLVKHCAEYALPLLRPRLRAGELSFDEAHATLGAIRNLWPTEEDRHAPSGIMGLRRSKAEQDEHDREEERERKQKIAALRPYLGARSVRGAVTTAEWTAWRALRGRLESHRRRDWIDLLGMIPPGPRAPEDQELVDRAMALFRSGETEIAFPLSITLPSIAQPSDAPLFDELLGGCAPRWRDSVRHARANVREALGMPLDEDEDELVATEAATAGDQSEWMDEDDD